MNLYVITWLLESIALLLGCKDELLFAGDPVLTSKYITTLAMAYAAQGEYSDAIRVCEESMELIEKFINVPQSSASTVTVKSKTTATSNTRSPGSVANGNNNKTSSETSYEMAQCISDVCILWLELSINEILYCIRTTGVKELRKPLFELYEGIVEKSGEFFTFILMFFLCTTPCSMLLVCRYIWIYSSLIIYTCCFLIIEAIIQAVISSVGIVSALAATLLSAYAKASLKIIQIIHMQDNSTLDISSYRAWIVKATKKAVNNLEVSVRTRREVLKCISSTQRKFVLGDGVEVNESIKAGMIGSDITIMTSSVQLQLGLDELELTYQLFNLQGLIKSRMTGKYHQ